MPTIKGSQNALTRKLGPLPAWAWAGIAGGALYLYRQHQAAGQAAANPNVPSTAPADVNPDTGLPWNIDPNTGEPYGDTGTVSSGGSTSTGGNGATGLPVTTPETGGPAPKKPKKKPAKKKKKLRIPRIGKAKVKGHGSHKAHPKPHPRQGRPKRKPLIPGRKATRDRQGVKSDHPTHHAARGRHSTPKAGTAGGRPAALASARSSSRAASRAIEQGGRAHLGEHNATTAARSRTSSPPAMGRNDRTKPMATAAHKAPAVPRREPVQHQGEAAHHSSSRGRPRSQPARRRK